MQERFNASIIKRDFNPVYHANAFTYPAMPVITNESRDEINFFNWGLIPSWIKNDSEADEIKKFTLNARAETVFEKPSFKGSIIKKRCIIPASGFFEWQHINKEKLPYYIRLSDKELFSFAGIWSIYTNEDKEQLFSYSIITSDANEFMANIHNTKRRMPVILDKTEEEIWLNNAIEKGDIQYLIRKKDQNFKAYTISKSLGNPKINSNTKNILKEEFYGNLNLGI